MATSQAATAMQQDPAGAPVAWAAHPAGVQWAVWGVPQAEEEAWVAGECRVGLVA
jgi:hypothetical protein